MKGNHLHIIFDFFKVALRNSVPTKKWLQAKGIDPKKIEVGLDSGRHHRGKDETYIRECLSHGTLTANPGGGYRSFARDCLIFPLKNEEGEIVNYFAQVMKANQFGFYLKEGEGLYPHFPAFNTREIILTEHILEAAVLLNNGASLLSLDNGVLSKRHKEVLLQLTGLEKILFSPYFTPSIRENIEHFVIEHIGDIKFGEYQIPINEVDQEKTKTSVRSLFHHQDPEYLQFEYEDIFLDVMGGLSEGLDQLKVTLKIYTKKGMSNGYRDVVNLYLRSQRSHFIQEVAESLYLEKEKVVLALNALTTELEQYRIERKDTDIQLSISRNALTP